MSTEMALLESGQALMRSLSDTAFTEIAERFAAAGDMVAARTARSKITSELPTTHVTAANGFPDIGFSLASRRRSLAMGRRLPMKFGRFAQARMGWTGEELVQVEQKILALTQQKPIYDSFVQFVLDTAPDGLKQIWPVDGYQVNEALRVFNANYASRHDYVEAAAWGARFPADMRGDMAFKRIQLNEPQWTEMFLGKYKPSPGYYFDPADPAAAAALQTLGTKWGTVRVVDDIFDYVQALEAETFNLFEWYAFVYRRLQAFVPVMAKILYDAGESPVKVYEALEIPNVNSLGFNLWVVSANTHIFSRMGEKGTAVLRGLLSDTMLEEVAEGFDFAKQLNDAELWFYQKAGAQIQAGLDLLEATQFVLKVLSLPATVVGDLPSLGSVPWYYWAGGAAGAVILLGGTLYVLRG